MDSGSDRKESKAGSAKRRKSVAKVSKLKGPTTKLMMPSRERSMSSDMESLGDMKSSLKRGVKYENTFRTDPNKDETFSCSKMESAMKDIMEETIGDTPYDPITCTTLVTAVANQIKDRAKIFPWTRTIAAVCCTI